MKKLICLLFLGLTAFASNAQESELTDTLYYKNGVIMACKVNKIDAWEIGFEKQHDTSVAFQTVSQNLIDSIYVFNPLRFSSVSLQTTLH